MHYSLPVTVTQVNAMQLHQEGLLNLSALKVVDCSALRDFDSSVLAVLLAWQKQLQSEGLSLTIWHAPEKLKVLANVYGISRLLGI